MQEAMRGEQQKLERNSRLPVQFHVLGGVSNDFKAGLELHINKR